MRVITFSTKFPKYHPRAGEETMFIEKIWKGLKTSDRRDGEYTIWSKHPRLMKAGYWQLPHVWSDKMNDKKFTPKFHTIRAGDRWKVGDFFSPRIWSGRPYASKQIVIAPPIEIKKIWQVEISGEELRKTVGIIHSYSIYQTLIPLADVAKNDGLSIEDFINWFPKNFVGQIICWNDKINYLDETE